MVMKWTLQRSVLAAGAPSAPADSAASQRVARRCRSCPTQVPNLDCEYLIPTLTRSTRARGAEHRYPKSVRTSISGGFLYVCLDVCWEDGMANASRYVQCVPVGGDGAPVGLTSAQFSHTHQLQTVCRDCMPVHAAVRRCQ